MQEVNSKKFDALMSKAINLKKCPKCPDIGGEIIIPMTAYGRRTGSVFVRCRNCGFETKPRRASITMSDEKNRLGCPIIPKSLMKAIHTAVNDWNEGRGNDGK